MVAAEREMLLCYLPVSVVTCTLIHGGACRYVFLNLISRFDVVQELRAHCVSVTRVHLPRTLAHETVCSCLFCFGGHFAKHTRAVVTNLSEYKGAC